MYLIWGVFFQDRDGQGLRPYEFHGKIREGYNGYDNLSGDIQDEFGDAELSDVSRTPKFFSFSKRYVSEPYAGDGDILYGFEKSTDGSWQGVWTRRRPDGKVETGVARCVLVQGPDDLFELPEEKQEVE